LGDSWGHDSKYILYKRRVSPFDWPKRHPFGVIAAPRMTHNRTKVIRKSRPDSSGIWAKEYEITDERSGEAIPIRTRSASSY